MCDFNCALIFTAEEFQQRQESVQKPLREPCGTPDQHSLAHVVKPRKRVQLLIDILGSTYATCPDSGTQENIMAKAISDQLDMSIDDAAEHQKEFRMANGKVVKALRRTSVDCAFTKEPDSQHQSSFYVLKALIAPIIMGVAFLDATETLTKYKREILASGRYRLRNRSRIARLCQAKGLLFGSSVFQRQSSPTCRWECSFSRWQSQHIHLLW